MKYITRKQRILNKIPRQFTYCGRWDDNAHNLPKLNHGDVYSFKLPFGGFYHRYYDKYRNSWEKVEDKNNTMK